MSRRAIRRHTLFCAASSVLSACYSMTPAAAQNTPDVPDPTVHLTKQQTSRFDEALTTLTEQGHVTIVAEGRPLHLKLTALSAPDLSVGLTTSAAVDKIASAYDYSVQRCDSVFVLKKRYTDPQDIPEVTPLECAEALNDIATVTDSFNPHIRSLKRASLASPVMDVVSTFTPEQMQMLHEKRLLVASLTEEQQELAYRTALWLHIQRPLEATQDPLRFLEQPSRVLFLEHSELDNPRPTDPTALCYEIPADLSGGPYIHPVGGSSGDVGTLGVRIAVEPPEAEGPGEPSLGMTLAQAVAALNARTAAKPALTVDAALAAKPITMAGAENAAPADLRGALADVYGLRLRTDEQGARQITRPLFQVPLDITGLAAAVQHVFPEPYLRALHVTPDTAEPGDPMPQQADPKNPTTAAQWHAAVRAWEDRYDERRRATLIKQSRSAIIRHVAEHRLSAKIESMLKTAPAGQVSLSTLGEPLQEAFANVQMSICLIQLESLLRTDMPYYIVNFSQDVLAGGPAIDENGRHYVALNFYVFDGRQYGDQAGITYFPRVQQ